MRCVAARTRRAQPPVGMGLSPVRRIRLRATRVDALVTRQRAALAIHWLLVAALVPASGLAGARLATGISPGCWPCCSCSPSIADFNEVPLPGGMRFDAGLPLALITLAVLGPLPALLVDLAPIAVGGPACAASAILRPGNLGNVAAYGWEAVAAAVARWPPAGAHAGCDALPWLLLAGVVMCFVNFSSAPASSCRCYLGQPVSRAAADVRRHAAGRAGDGHAGRAHRACSSGRSASLALALFALIAVLPQTALTYAARTRPVAALDPLTATRRYAHALALHLGLDRAERRHLARVTAARVRPPRRRRRPDRLRPPDAARPEPRVLGGRPRRRVVERRRRPGGAARPGHADRPRGSSRWRTPGAR